MDLIWRPLTLHDVAAATELNNTVALADGTGEVITQGAQADFLNQPRFDRGTDTMSVWKGTDLIGAGVVSSRETLVEGRALMGTHGHIHPDHRRQGLGTQLLTWLQERALALAGARFPGAPVRLRTSGDLAGSPTQRLLEAFGYTPDNSFLTMEVDLASWADPGTGTRAVAPDVATQDAIREAHNDSFRDHRNHSEISASDWQHFATMSTVRPELSRVIRDGDRVLAYAIAGEHQPGVVHINLVGTRREVRGQGLAKDVLIAALRAARDAGYRVSELEVDSTSPTGADRLYRSVGYQEVRVISRYIRDVG
ncbi:GNAT family N-acetyltransferase [Pseudactinotalea sp. Z1739]|uniref:GNAT family N-acetyltransferase n=1 Tax=Pseudactinotalea sp. Z1739 TaxID=3413028 RepID=UPI003C7A7CCC